LTKPDFPRSIGTFFFLDIYFKSMGQIKDTLVKMKCSECSRVTHYTKRNKKKVKEKLEMSKFCKFCRKHTPHAESK
jgi:large subunit ribosomal protein L33